MRSSTAPAAPGCRCHRSIILTLLCGGFVAVFLVIARQVMTGGALTEVDITVGEAMQEVREQASGLRVVAMAFTLLAAFETMVVLVPLIAIFLWRRGRALAILWLCMGIGAGVINTTMKRHFERDRPAWKDAWVYENNESFPSGHSFSSAAVFGLLTYLLIRFRPEQRIPLLAGGVALILVVGFSRVFLGAHYLSDVLGGFCGGTAWLLLGILTLESFGLIPDRSTMSG